MIAWTLFVHPVLLPQSWSMWMILPLCLAVATVYKTIRTHHERHLPRQIFFLMLYMVGGLAALGGLLWLIQVIFL